MSDVESSNDERSLAREAVLALLYEGASKGCDARELVELAVVPHDELVRVLVDGVEETRSSLDAIIGRFSQGWSLERMPTIDLLILRLATYELAHRPEVPVAVVIDEAVELAKRFSTDDSGRFVNGVLASIARDIR